MWLDYASTYLSFNLSFFLSVYLSIYLATYVSRGQQWAGKLAGRSEPCGLQRGYRNVCVRCATRITAVLFAACVTVQEEAAGKGFTLGVLGIRAVRIFGGVCSGSRGIGGKVKGNV